MPSNTDACAECLRLAAEYESLSAVHSSAMECLLATQASEDSDVYRTVRILADETRIDRELARLDISKHQDAHANGLK